MLFDYLVAGSTLENFLRDFPRVSRELAFAALAEANLELRREAGRCSDPGG
jgi:hypothetical protein